MGFPSTGSETIYRNIFSDLKPFLDKYLWEYKRYNLFIGKNRKYPNNLWKNKRVKLFPFNDHASCPIKLILDFCIDLYLYLTLNLKGISAIYCKTGKVRTDVKKVCYLIILGLYENFEEALIHYANKEHLIIKV